MSTAESYTFELLAGGIAAAEGPVVDLDGRTFMVASNDHHILHWHKTGQVSVYADTGAIPAGLQVDRENNLWCADMGRGILRVDTAQRVHEEVCSFEGKPIRGCNDLYFDSQGNLYFTAPAGSNADNPVGELFCRLHNGNVVRLDDGYRFCNGLAVSADDKQLIVAETFTKLLWAYDIIEPGVVTNKRIWAKMSEPGFGPDGMDFDCEGNLLVAYVDAYAVDVFSPVGEHIDRIVTPFKRPSNVHFDGPDSCDLLITGLSESGLWKTTWKRPGQMQYCFTNPSSH